MSIRDELASVITTRGSKCRVTQFLDRLSDADRAETLELLADPSWTSAAFARWSEQRKDRVGDQSWSRHRRGECGCGRS